MSKNVAVFVDVANIFYAAKAAGVDIDYVTLLKASSAGRDLVRAYAYTGLDPDNENQRNFHEFLRRHGYKVVSKDIRKYGDGKVKANLDIELVVDMMKTARNLDIAIVISGDGDFAPAIRAVQEMGVRVEVVSFRGNTSSDLIDVADLFTDITQIAKVEKGSSRSGRRVADDDEDLSMTEVPDKQSEGTGEPRRRGGRSRTSRTTTETTPTGRTRRAPAAPKVAAAAASDVPLVVLPGEKLSRVAAAPLARDTDDETEDLIAAELADDDVDADDTGAVGGAPGIESAEDGAHRRRRRRGGRGRGRGRREEGAPEGTGDAPVTAGEADDDDFEAPVAPPRRPAASTFGSVWDSQIGVPGAPVAATGGRQALIEEDEDLDEPPIPEYLIAERRQRDAVRPGRAGGGNRGGRGGAYATAMDRERFGGGRGSTMSRFGDQGAPRRDAPPRRDGGPNRIDRPAFRPENRPAPRPVSSDEPWSEVPPEIEAMLRAQLASGGRNRPTGGPGRAPERRPAQPAMAAEPERAAEAAVAPAAARPARRGARTAAPAAPVTSAGAAATGETVDAAAPKRRAPRTAKPTAGASSGSASKKTATRSTAKAATTTRSRAKAAPTADSDAPSTPDPKRRTRKPSDATA
ncbi:MAG TPA: NYN domain-containing protein [Candidatus Limnocylindrales bacterium]|nr:NYN domain-containing protein [Candidatus Limnocylindrales bacterium]